MSEEPDVISDWIRERVLGSGGFGIVTLWRNIKTHDRIAIKKYREESTANLTQKQRERWTQEVQMMQRIQNENIVNFRDLPPDFACELNKYNPSKLPMLSMEYCSRGDLRSVLVQSENSCGLPESDVRTILADLKSAVSYLHTLKITHRDLKPENIVLQYCDRPSNIIYKLIDLGYAKELDAKSISASFVGTLQYLAPELMYSKTYSCSVDYWSMGQVAFEVICGTRPFLPNMSPAQWMFHAHKKSSETICIYQQTEKSDSIKYSNEIFAETHVSTCFKREIEKWLQLALEYNPRKRGHKIFSPENNPENELAIFTSLKVILDKKIITVFLVYNCEFCSYEIDEFTQISTVQKWVERDTKLAQVEQVLLSPLCEKIDPNGLAIQVFDKTYRETMLYIFKKTVILSEDIELKMVPQLVKDMLDGSSKELTYYFQKRSYAHALYFIYKETKLYNSILDACSLKIKYLLQLCDCTTENCKLMNLQLDKLVSQTEYSKELLNFDCKQYLKNYSQTAQHWLDSFNSVVDKIQKLSGLCAQITIRFDSAIRRAYLLNNAFCKDFSKHSNHDLNELLDTAISCYDGIRKKAKDARAKPEPCKSMLKIVYDVLKSRDKLLRDRQFKDILQKIVDMDHELDKILPTITGGTDHIKKFYKDLLADNLERQTKIWDFTIKPKAMPPRSPVPEPAKAHFILGNLNSLKDDPSTPISLSKPLHFILGESQKNSSLESNSSFHSPCGSSPAMNSIDKTVNCTHNEPKSMERIAQNNPAIKEVAQTSPTIKEVTQNNRVVNSGKTACNSGVIIAEQMAQSSRLIAEVTAQNSGVNIPEQMAQSSRLTAEVIAQNSRVNNPKKLIQDSGENIAVQTAQNSAAIVEKVTQPITQTSNAVVEETAQDCRANIAEAVALNVAPMLPKNEIENTLELKQNCLENVIEMPKISNEINLFTVRLPNFQIGAPTSDIIQYNTSLRYELQEMTNESFIKCKSILSETLDFGFLNE